MYRLRLGDLSPIIVFSMSDIYELALKKLATDSRSLNELEREIGVPSETLRDIKSGHVGSPRFDTLKKIAQYYQRA